MTQVNANLQNQVSKDVNMDGAYRSRFLVASLVIFSHSYGFVQQQHLELFIQGTSNWVLVPSLSVTFSIWFLCQASSCKMFMQMQNEQTEVIPLRSHFKRCDDFIKRCNRIFASYVKAIVIIASLLWLLESMHDPNGIGRQQRYSVIIYCILLEC